MNKRKLPHGSELICPLGIGMGGIQSASEAEIESTVRAAIQNGINFFDLCAGGAKVYAPFGRAIHDCRENVFFQLHLGAVYSPEGEYGWSRDLNRIRETFEWELKTLGADYADFGFLHCIDEMDDVDAVIDNGILDYAKSLKSAGRIHHIGFSSHTPAVAHRLLDTGLIDMMMFSINPAYDLEKGDDYGIGTAAERANLFRRCEKEGVGISVMKPFHAGKLLSDASSPFHKALSRNQCLQYAMDRPGVLAVVPGVRGMEDLNALLEFFEAAPEARDYSAIGSFTPESALGNCVYCNHCQPCPAGIDVGLVNKYYDLARAGDDMARNHYSKLSKNASDCLSCGHCNDRCPFRVDQMARMAEIDRYFAE